MRLAVLFIGAVACCSWPALAGAQASQPVLPSPAIEPAALPEPYSYNPEGRRDPFVSLLARGTDLRAPAHRPTGLPGLLIGEVTVRGILRSGGAVLAMLQAPDNRTYIVQPDARLLDGRVKAITADAVIFLQEVDDPLSLVKEREVRKPLRVIEEGN